MKRKRYNQPVHKKWIDPSTKSYDDHLKDAYDRGQIDKDLFRENFKKPRGVLNMARVVSCSQRNRPPKDFY